ncbi:MAG: hypothetical protein IJW57_11320 [Spirochaetaceae bacterium]|nr:hypothetical protein [Spirochaetaceae bacterium]MBR2461646.1 hypothetical protein [Spirochaetaceae bacterium]
MSESEKDQLTFTYTFTPQETAILARFIRWQGLPDGLERFSAMVIDTMYNSMTIHDMEQFFKK